MDNPSEPVPYIGSGWSRVTVALRNVSTKVNTSTLGPLSWHIFCLDGWHYVFIKNPQSQPNEDDVGSFPVRSWRHCQVSSIILGTYMYIRTYVPIHLENQGTVWTSKHRQTWTAMSLTQSCTRQLIYTNVASVDMAGLE